MYCLWNGEYGEHDLSYVSGLDGIIKNQKETYPGYVGMVVGDFTCLDVEYDWGRRDQRWKIRCNLCGKESYQYHTFDWRRGKGRKLTCDCRKREEIEKREIYRKELNQLKESAKKQREEKIRQLLGKNFHGWKVIEYNGNKRCAVKCNECGAIRRKHTIDDVINGSIYPCNHVKPNNYSGEEWIGKRVGHLTTIGRKGSCFVAVCDCGRKRIVRGTDLFKSEIVRTCGQDGCEFSSKHQIEANKKKRNGFLFESDMESYLRSLGLNANKTKKVGDYGVDIIIDENDGSKTAIQCKTDAAPASVSSVQEVYAGGRFYGCTKFCVICKSGFSNQAINMANVLGVYLCKGNYNPPTEMSQPTSSLLPIHGERGAPSVVYKIGNDSHTLSDWCAIYDIPKYVVDKRIKRGITLETALKLPYHKSKDNHAFGLTGSIDAFAKLFNITAPAVSYRMKVKGMTLEEALTAEKTWNKKNT